MKKALVVGINNYQSAPLRSCINDATELKAIIERNGDGSLNFDAKLATDVRQRSGLTSLIADLFKGKSETALLYFAGHGYINELGGYLVTPDSRRYDEGVSMADILVLANNSSATNKVIILDCCHSGAMGALQNSGGSAAQIMEGITILTSSLHDEPAFENNGHGVFTSLLLQALKGGAADLRGYITPGSVYAYIDQALGPWDQRPVFKTNITRFTPLRHTTPQVEIDTLRKLVEYFPTSSHHYALNPEYEYTQPESKPDKVIIFKHLQRYESVGLVVPVSQEHMYWEAMYSGYCKLTPLGYHYWRLVSDGRI